MYYNAVMLKSEANTAAGALLLVFQLPARKSSGRVAVWRRLQRLGANSLGGAAYALPANDENQESAEWLREEIAALGGRSTLFAAREILLPEEHRTALAAPPIDPAAFRRRLWVTRPRPGVDRLASAWLIRRFVDSGAGFAFARRLDEIPPEAVSFDMVGATFGHRGGRCSFQGIAAAFSLRSPVLKWMGELVRAIDLHEEASDAAEAALVDRLIEGLRASYEDDQELLAAGMALFEALFRSAPAARTGRSSPRIGSRKP